MTTASSFSPTQFKSRLIKSLGANAFGQLVSVAIQLLNVPIFLHYWGVQMYGEWLILSAIPAYLNLSDIGFASVAGNDMTMRVAKGDEKGALEVYQSIWLLISTTSLAVGCFAGILAWLIPLNHHFSLSHIPANEITLALCALLLYTLVSLQGGVLSAGFRASGNYAYGTVLNNIARLIEALVTIIVLATGGGVLIITLALLIGKCITTISLWLALGKRAAWLSHGYHAAKLSTIRQLYKPAIAFMAFPLGLALNIQGMTLVIGALLGPTAITIFSTYRTLTRLLIQVIGLLNQALWPEISRGYGAGDLVSVRKIHRQASAATFWVGLAGIMTLELFGTYIIGIWTHHTFTSNYQLLALLLIDVFLYNLWQSSLTVLIATNRHQTISITFILSAAFGLLLGNQFLPIFGLNGAAIALIVAELPILFFAINLALKLVRDDWIGYLTEIIQQPSIFFRRFGINKNIDIKKYD